MNGITHNQAIKWIHRRQDGLIKEDQQSLLEEHLRSCDSCHTYAEEMEAVSAHLQNKFHHRWDQSVGPSQNVTESVMLKARKIPITNRISSSVKIFASAMAIVLLMVAINLVVSRLQSPLPTTTDATETIYNSPLPEKRLLAFTSSQNGNSEIYTMHPDGSGLTNITNHPALDGYPFWSPDGKQIVFMSDRDGSPQIYLMESDGSNMIQLTQGEGKYLLDVNGYTPWSPDGRKLIYSYRSPEETSWNLYVLDMDESTSTALTNEPGQYILPSWSPDGEHIAFISTPSDRSFQQIFVVDKYGNDLAHLTETLTTSEFFVFGDYSWSQDGISITFSTHSHGQGGYSSAYKASLDGSLTVLARTDTLMVDWWNGTALQHDPDGKTLTWLRSDSSQSTLNLCLSDDQIRGIAYRRSQDGNLAFGSNCSGSGWKIYFANPDGTVVHELLDSPLPANGNTDHIFNMTWSPDDRYLSFVSTNIASADVTSTLYVLDVQKALEDPSIQPLKMTNSSGPSWQPVVDENIVEEIPTSMPPDDLYPGDLIAFTSDQNGNLDIYTVHTDGSGLTNLTNDPAAEHSPAWSPDGVRLAFVSDRDGSENIYVMNADGSELKRLTNDPGSDISPLWSPDGTKIAYGVKEAGGKSADVFVMDSNGQNHRRLTDHAPDADAVWPEAWSLDGEYLFFYLNGQIAKVHVDSGEIDPVTPLQDVPYYFSLSRDGLTILYFAGCSSGEFCQRAKSIHTDGTNEQTHQTLELEQVCTSNKAPANEVNDYYYTSNWSPDRTKIIFAFNCFHYGVQFYIANTDGSDFRMLMNMAVPGDNLAFAWSPDSRSFIFASRLDGSQSEGLYVFDIEKALQNPDISPAHVSSSIGQISSFSWQPAP